ncbi:hypothetical protein F0358_06940 [Empedobacter brevis]|uniref:hypothetical protein n=1 Tax=Empedobacter brevis TaxID=247 RepID=UPI00123D9BE6|nr:hypothetical protein [Empedobacter brevis]QES92470.1 hypothetical protein F0358_06940 [Empedobacter brevis]
MTKKLLTFGFLVASFYGYAQVGVNTSNPDPSAILELKHSNKGLLIPRVNLTGRTDLTTIPSPANGLLVYNLANANNGTTTTTVDDVIANNYYFFSTASNNWELLVNQVRLEEAIDNLGVPRLLLIASFPSKSVNNSSVDYLSPTQGTASNNIRQMYFKAKLYEKVVNSYDVSTSVFTAPYTGYYQIDANTLLKSNQAQATTKLTRLGVSKPFIGTSPSVYNNGTFAILNQPLNPAVTTSDPLTLSISGVMKMTKGEKIMILSRYITPDTATGDSYSADTETAFGINRNDANTLTITYYPVN